MTQAYPACPDKFTKPIISDHEYNEQKKFQQNGMYSKCHKLSSAEDVLASILLESIWNVMFIPAHCGHVMSWNIWLKNQIAERPNPNKIEFEFPRKGKHVFFSRMANLYVYIQIISLRWSLSDAKICDL